MLDDEIDYFLHTTKLSLPKKYRDLFEDFTEIEKKRIRYRMEVQGMDYVKAVSYRKKPTREEAENV